VFKGIRTARRQSMTICINGAVDRWSHQRFQHITLFSPVSWHRGTNQQPPWQTDSAHGCAPHSWVDHVMTMRSMQPTIAGSVQRLYTTPLLSKRAASLQPLFPLSSVCLKFSAGSTGPGAHLHRSKQRPAPFTSGMSSTLVQHSTTSKRPMPNTQT